MEVRTSDSPEPSHIHVPRPSQSAGRQTLLLAPNEEDLRALCDARDESSPPTGTV
jgi:hypothetical protein